MEALRPEFFDALYTSLMSSVNITYHHALVNKLLSLLKQVNHIVTLSFDTSI